LFYSNQILTKINDSKPQSHVMQWAAESRYKLFFRVCCYGTHTRILLVY